MSEFLQIAFDEVLAQERAISEAKLEIVTVTTPLEIKKAQAEQALEKAWQHIAALMAETGEFEVLLPGENCDYKIAYSKPRQNVEVDDDAVPDEFCKLVRTPNKKEIKEMLESGAKVNWARLKDGESKLNWRTIKKGAQNAE